MASLPRWLAILSANREKPPYLLEYRSSKAFIITTVALAVFTDMFLYGIIVPVIPFALEGRSNIAHDNVQHWVSVLIAVYGAALLAFSPICGWLADQSSSRRSPLLMGLLVLLGSTILLNVGTSIPILVLGRILQGASAAVVWVVGLALLSDTVPQEHLSQAFGYVTLGMSLGLLTAPLLAGVVFERAGYTAVFAMAYALVGFDILLRLALVEKKVAARWLPDQNAPGNTLESDNQKVEHVVSPSDIGTSKEVGLPNQTPETRKPFTKSSQPPTLPQPQKTLRSRLPPVLSLLYSRRLLSALFGALIQAALITAFDSVLAIRAARIFNWNSTGAGLLFLPLVLPSFLAPIVGYLTDRVGARYPAALGFLLAAPPLICLRFVTENSLRQKVLLCALLAMVGLALTFTMPPVMTEISKVVEAKERNMVVNGEKGWGKGGGVAQAFGLYNMAFAAGCLAGPLLAGFIVDEEGWGVMSWVLGLLSAVTAFPTWLWMEGWIGKAWQREGRAGEV